MATTSDPEKQPLLTSTSDERSTLAELQQNIFAAQRAYAQEYARVYHGRMHPVIRLVVIMLLSVMLIICMSIALDDGSMTGGFPSDLEPGSPRRWRDGVPLEVHIMSKCPDARDCLHDLILPAMINVSDIVDFKLSYIGSITDHDDGVLCMHGPQECLGNIIELCAQKLYRDPKMSLGFTMCLSKNFKDIPEQELVEDCALEHGISIAELNACAVDQDGVPSVSMLQDSFKRSAAANVTTSCTIRLDEEVYCIRDDGQWKECKDRSKPADLIAAIEKNYQDFGRAFD